jgi:hypothetical protein
MGGLADLSSALGRTRWGRNVGSSEGREKMNEAIRTRNPWRTVAMVLLAVLVLVVVALASMLQPSAPVGAGGRAVHPGVNGNIAEGAGGSGIANDPFIGRHAEVVATYRGVIPDQPSATRENLIDRHAEVVARYHQGNPR